MNKAWFLDRDGTIIIDKNYLGDPEGVEILENAGEALARAQKEGYILIVVTNQSGIARGYFTENDADLVDQRLGELLAEYGVKIAKFYRCPHLPEGKAPYNIVCKCRKPETGLFEQAILDFDLDPSQCIACGDKVRDIENLERLGIPRENLGLVGESGYKDLLEFFQDVSREVS